MKHFSSSVLSSPLKWDGGQLTQRTYLDAKGEEGFKLDRNLRTFVQQGYIEQKNKLIVQSLDHALEVEYRRVARLPKLYTWSSPHLGQQSVKSVPAESRANFLAQPAAARAVLPTPAAPQPPAAAGMTTPPGDAADAPAAAAAQPVPSPHPPAPPASPVPSDLLVNGLTAELAVNYVISPHILGSFDTSLSDFICQGVADADVQRYLDICDYSGVGLLVLMYKASEMLNPDGQLWASDEFNTMEQAGLTDLTTAAFSQYRNNLTKLNNVLPPALRHDEIKLHYFYKTAIQRAGLLKDFNHAATEFKVDNPGVAIGNDELIGIIMSVLTTAESEAMRLARVSARALIGIGGGNDGGDGDGRGGRGGSGSDRGGGGGGGGGKGKPSDATKTQRPPRVEGGRGFKPGLHRNCRHCQGEHFDNKCPSKPEPTVKQTGGANIASAALAFDTQASGAVSAAAGDALRSYLSNVSGVFGYATDEKGYESDVDPDGGFGPQANALAGHAAVAAGDTSVAPALITVARAPPLLPELPSVPPPALQMPSAPSSLAPLQPPAPSSPAPLQPPAPSPPAPLQPPAVVAAPPPPPVQPPPAPVTPFLAALLAAKLALAAPTARQQQPPHRWRYVEYLRRFISASAECLFDHISVSAAMLAVALAAAPKLTRVVKALSTTTIFDSGGAAPVDANHSAPCALGDAQPLLPFYAGATIVLTFGCSRIRRLTSRLSAPSRTICNVPRGCRALGGFPESVSWYASTLKGIFSSCVFQWVRRRRPRLSSPPPPLGRQQPASPPSPVQPPPPPLGRQQPASPPSPVQPPQGTLASLPPLGRGVARLAFASQAGHQRRPPGLNHPPAQARAQRAGRKSPTEGSLSFEAVIDSGCTWHSHPRRTDLVNIRACDDVITTADGADHTATCIGSLPVLAYDTDGEIRLVLIPNVRCMPLFKDTLISVDELWQLSRFDTRFRDIRQVQASMPGSDAIAFCLPFVKRNGLFVWDLEIGTRSRVAALSAAFKARTPAPAVARLATGASAAGAAAVAAPPVAVAAVDRSGRAAGAAKLALNTPPAPASSAAAALQSRDKFNRHAQRAHSLAHRRPLRRRRRRRAAPPP